jgi:hypothetical protein
MHWSFKRAFQKRPFLLLNWRALADASEADKAAKAFTSIWKVRGLVPPLENPVRDTHYVGSVNAQRGRLQTPADPF